MARNPQFTQVSKRQSYQWVCNTADLQFSSIRVCQNYLQLTVREETCTADPNDREKGHLCHNNDTRVTALSWKGKKETVKCKDAGDAVYFLYMNCASKGGA